MALTTTLQKVEALYVAYYGRAGDPSGVSYWTDVIDNGGKSVADVAGFFALQTESKIAYPYLANPALVDPTTFVAQVYQNLFARAPEAAGLNYWVAALNANNGNPGFVGQFINYVIGGAAPADAAVLDNKVAAGIYFTQTVATEGFDITGPDGQLTPEGAAAAKAATGPTVTGDAASVDASKHATDLFDVSTPFHLTTGADNVVGTSGADTIHAGSLAPDGIAHVTTLNVLDSINGGGGIDTLVVDVTGSVNTTIQGTITGVENLTYVGAGAIGNLDGSQFSGTIRSQQTTSTLTVLNATDQTFVLDRAMTGTGMGLYFAPTQTSTKLQAIGNTGDNGFLISGAALKTVDLAIDKTTTGNAMTLNSASGGVETVNVTAGGATDLVINSTGLKSVKVDGAGKLTLVTSSQPTQSIDASGNSGGVVVVDQLKDGAIFTGGSGNDSVILGANTRAITLGAGNDSVSLTLAALGMGGTVDGGDGIDTINMDAVSAAMATSDAVKGAAFAASISNFEKLGIGITGLGLVVVDAQYLDGINSITSAGTGSLGPLQIKNLAANATFETTAAQQGGVTLKLKDASGLNDAINLKYTADAGFNSTGALHVADIETINIATFDAKDAATAFTADIIASAVKSVVITGNAGIDLTGELATTTLTLLDASGVTASGTAGAVKYMSPDLAAAATIKGGAGDDSFNLTAATKSVTVDGGAGNDMIGTGSGADIINGGAGDDLILSGFGLDIITGGAGKDYISLVANTNGNIYATITDASAGDILNFADLGGETFNDAKITLAETAVFQDYLNAASVGNHAAAGQFGWFQFGGNTFVVEDRAAGDSFVNGTNVVVKLSGLVDISTAVLGDHSLTLA